MRILTLILVLLSCLLGFIFSYGYAYRTVSGALFSTPATMQSSTAFTAETQ